jgi:choline monooxygenase
MNQPAVTVVESETATVRAALEQPIEKATGLPGEWYSSETWARTESHRLFARTWLCVGFVHELTQPGTAIPIDIAGFPLLLTCNNDGVQRAFHNVCPHRGFRLVNESVADKSVIRCPYHAWAFDMDGELRSTPHWGGYREHKLADFDTTCHGLYPVRCERWNQWVFVNIDGEAAPLADYIAPFATHFEEYDLANLKHCEMVPFEVPGNWKLVEENFLEVAHLPPIHKRLSEYAPFQDHEIVFDDHCMGTVIETGLPAAWSEDPLPRFPGIAAHAQNAKNIALFPNFKLVIGPDHCASMVEIPTDVALTKQRWDFYFYGENSAEDRYEAARRCVIDFFVETNEEDMSAVAGLHQGRTSPGYRGGVFSKVWEPGVHHFQKLVAYYMDRQR